jgi:hypothetical protein
MKNECVYYLIRICEGEKCKCDKFLDCHSDKGELIVSLHYKYNGK